jgi:ABC-type proline/glycine betaine transport system permease subunit
MIWGIHLGVTDNFTLAPAHAHLNLIGWATSGLYGVFYALTKETMAPKLAWTQFWISTIGVAIMIPSLALFLLDPTVQTYMPGVAIGSLLVLVGLIMFGVSVVREFTRKRA